MGLGAGFTTNRSSFSSSSSSPHDGRAFLAPVSGPCVRDADTGEPKPGGKPGGSGSWPVDDDTEETAGAGVAITGAGVEATVGGRVEVELDDVRLEEVGGSSNPGAGGSGMGGPLPIGEVMGPMCPGGGIIGDIIDDVMPPGPSPAMCAIIGPAPGPAPTGP